MHFFLCCSQVIAINCKSRTTPGNFIRSSKHYTLPKHLIDFLGSIPMSPQQEKKKERKKSRDLLFSFCTYYRGTTLGLKFKFLVQIQRMLLPEKIELTHKLISTFPQGTAAFMYSWYMLKKGSLIFKTGPYHLSGSHSSRCLTLDIQNECTSESLVLF